MTERTVPCSSGRDGVAVAALARVAALLALCVLGAAALAAPAPAAAADTAGEVSTDSFAAVADARVEEANPAINYGSGTRLGSDGDQGARIESYLRFSVSGIRPTVRSAKLRLYVVSDGSVDGPSVYAAGGDWSETSLTWQTRPGAVGPAVSRTGSITPGTWIELDVTPLVKGDGSVDLVLAQTGTDGAIFYSRQGVYKPSLTVTSSDPVVMAAGDIACKPGAVETATTCRQAETANLLTGEPWLTSVLMLGDGQYEDGLLSEYTAAGTYNDTWGRVKAITKPAPGNHEYHVAGAPGYFGYFGDSASPVSNGYYSFNLGGWHLVSLNSEISTAVGSAQEKWLRADLAATGQPCILAYWHRPRFSSGTHGSSSSLAPIWQALYDARADVVLSGHDHIYERFAPQNPSGQPTSDGIREFVVGTGGAEHGTLGTAIAPNSEVVDTTTFGVLRLALHRSSYDWSFVPDSGQGFSETGSSSCHVFAPIASVTATPSSGSAPLDVTADASASLGGNRTPITSYSFDFGDGSAATGPQAGAVAKHTYSAPGTYVVTVRVTDSAGQVGTSTTQVVVKADVNLVRNPGFETGTLGWNTSGSSPDVTLSQAAGGTGGEWAAQLTNTGATAGTCVLNDSPNWVRTTVGGGYTGSMWVRGDAAGARLRLRFREWNGTVLAGSATSELLLSTSWQKIVVHYTPVAPAFSTLDFNAYVTGAAPGSCFYADDAVIAQD